ncbi:hypothetical protein G7Y79_00032g067250 [Physcia stellaris]|nr:hypothetical protein G7Y79_00032g067250 [Physcia stellaris]
MDYEYANTPSQDVSSQEFIIANFNSTYYGFSEVNNFAIDQRGYNAFIHGQASEFLEKNDPRLLLSTIVTNISWSDTGVTIHNADSTCIEADYAITTFSVGVLQSTAINFTPALPRWKRVAIGTFQMGVYTKIFFQFPPDKIFWDKSTQFFLYASRTRGYYPVWQNLDQADFFPGSGIFFVTVVTEQSYIVDHQDDDTTKAQILVTLRQIFGAENVPEPIPFMYPRWSTTPTPESATEYWQAVVCGEATSSEYFGYLHGAYFEGKAAGEKIAACLKGSRNGECENGNVYRLLHGTTRPEEYNAANGCTQTSFQTVGDVDLEGGGG